MRIDLASHLAEEVTEEQKERLAKYKAILIICGYRHDDVMTKLSGATQLESAEMSKESIEKTSWVINSLWALLEF